jgi:hypothetical protein
MDSYPLLRSVPQTPIKCKLTRQKIKDFLNFSPGELVLYLFFKKGSIDTP